jgi:hypothetical protein
MALQPPCVANVWKLKHSSAKALRQGHRRGKDRDEIVADTLAQHRIGIDVLSIGFELDAFPRHDGALAGNVGRRQRLTSPSTICANFERGSLKD